MQHKSHNYAHFNAQEQKVNMSFEIGQSQYLALHARMEQQEQIFIQNLKNEIIDDAFDDPLKCDQMINRVLTKTEFQEVFPPRLWGYNCWIRLEKIKRQKDDPIRHLHRLAKSTVYHGWYRDVLTQLLAMRNLHNIETDCKVRISQRDRVMRTQLQKHTLEELFPHLSVLTFDCLERPIGHSKIVTIVPRLKDTIPKAHRLLLEFERLLPKIEHQRRILFSELNADSLVKDKLMEPAHTRLESIQSVCTEIYRAANVSCKEIASMNALIEYDYIVSTLRGCFDSIKKRGDLSNIKGFITDISWLKKFQENELETINGLRNLPMNLQAIRDCFDSCIKFINERRSQLCAAQQEETLRREDLRVQIRAQNQTLLTLLSCHNNIYRAGKQYLELIDKMIKAINFNNDFSCLSVDIISRIIQELSDRFVKGTLTANDFIRLIPCLYEKDEMNTVLLRQLKMITGTREVSLQIDNEANNQNTVENI